jgi:release factor H-coupled RctB family protein
MGYSIIASQRNWIEGDAVKQLSDTAKLPGMLEAVGMPDLHPSKGGPVGAAFASEGRLYPHLVGEDIGCGMALWQTTMRGGKLKLDRWLKRLNRLEGPWDGDGQELLRSYNVAATDFDKSLGTIGRGNHFAELQRVHAVLDAEQFASMGLDPKALFVLVHSGSRGLGESILREHIDRSGHGGVDADSDEARRYLAAHDNAVIWARANRYVIAQRFMECMGTEGTQALDVTHNNVQCAHCAGRPCWLHRKGAAPSDVGPVVIAGSRGTLSYLVVATGDQEKNLSTLAHGAGRKWRRSDCKGRLERRFSREDLQTTDLGGRVICEDNDLLWEEAPQAYKNIDVVVQDLVDAGIVRCVATFAPLISYKTRRIER